MRRTLYRSFLGCTGLLLLAAGCSSDTSQRDDSEAVAAAYSGLVGDVAACGQGVAECARDAQGDLEALEACRADLAGCVDEATEAAGELADAASGCAADASACFSDAAGDPEAVGACREELAACLGIEMPEAPAEPDAEPETPETPEAPDASIELPEAADAAPVSDCIQTLLTCLSDGGDPPTCAGDVAACVGEVLPAPEDLGMPEDAGASQAGDQGMVPEDAGAPEEPGDQGMTPEDVPTEAPDAGMAPEDASGEAPEGLGDLPIPEDTPASDAVSCLEQLHSCVSDGGAPGDCLAEMRECVMGLGG